MDHQKEENTKLAKKNAIERMLSELSDVKPYGRTTREMYQQLKFSNPTDHEKYQKYFNEELKKLEVPEKEEIKNNFDEKDKQIEELIDTLKRLQAEFENYKKRVDRENAEFVKYAHAKVIVDLLPIIDSFEIALKNISDKDKFIDGMKMIYAQLHSALEAEGLRPIKAAGEQFDPYRHEVLLKEGSEKPEGTILEEFQKGYMLNDKVLRFSKVKVSGK